MIIPFVEIVVCWLFLTPSGEATCICKTEPDSSALNPPAAVEVYEPYATRQREPETY